MVPDSEAKEALFYESADGVVSCELCPHHCTISDNQTGVCRVRRNVFGKLIAETYGKVAAIGVDPIEKKPLFHFFPGEKTLSIATSGCNMRCQWCQNWDLSQHGVEERLYNPMTPEYIVIKCRQEGLRHISYTYNEPTVFYEYALDIMKAAHKQDIKNSWVTNGFIMEKPFLKAAKYMDAMNMDFKAGNAEDYKKYCSADALEVVKRTAELALDKKVHLEITTLIVPGINDDMAQLETIFKFLEDLNKDIPLHLSRFHPDYNMQDKEPTPLETMKKAAKLARKHLNYVYLGNVFGEEENTTCPTCKSTIIKRVGYSTSIEGLKDGACSKCGGKIPIVR